MTLHNPRSHQQSTRPRRTCRSTSALIFAIIYKRFTPVSRMASTVVSARLEIACRASSSFVALRCFNNTFWVSDCGNVLTVGSKSAPPEDCSTKCVGDASQTCGGNNRLSIYWSGATPPPQPTFVSDVDLWHYVGCFR